MQFRRTKKPTTAMDLGPLLDCVLQLLIFFMLTSTFMTPKISIALPEATTSDGTTDPDVIVITATQQDGAPRLFVNQEPVTIEHLEQHLEPLLKQSEHKAVVFRGDQDIAYQLFIRVIDGARRAGARNLDIAHTVENTASEIEVGP